MGVHPDTQTLKPILYCNAKPFALGRHVSVPQLDHFALDIPTCWYPKSLADPTQVPMNPTRVTPNAKPNSSWWNIACVGSPSVGARVGHVHFVLFMSISFALGSQHKPQCWVNTGSSFVKIICKTNQCKSLYLLTTPIAI